MLKYLWHLRMGEVFIDNDSLDQHGVFHTTSNFGLYFDEFKIDIPMLDISHGQNSIDSDLSHQFVTLIDDLGTQGGHGDLDQFFWILRIDFKVVGNGA